MKLKLVLDNMLTHPYFVFISSEGEIISRDFHQAFDKAQEVMKSEFDD